MTRVNVSLLRISDIENRARMDAQQGYDAGNTDAPGSVAHHVYQKAYDKEMQRWPVKEPLFTNNEKFALADA